MMRKHRSEEQDQRPRLSLLQIRLPGGTASPVLQRRRRGPDADPLDALPDSGGAAARRTGQC